jgi:hypothetical protein
MATPDTFTGVTAAVGLAENRVRCVYGPRRRPMLRNVLIALLCAAGCGSESPADVAGTYTLSLTVQQNACGILNNDVGTTSTGVQIVMTQSGSDVSGQVQGVGGTLLSLALGSNTFTGKMSGDSLDVTIAGTTPGADGTCAFTRNAHMQAKLTGDVLTGTITYSFATNRTADCGAKDTCQDVQAFNGTRPPKV